MARFSVTNINTAIVNTLADLLTNPYLTAKDLQGTTAYFFVFAAGKTSPEGEQGDPEGYCSPYGTSPNDADLDSLKVMCEAILAAIQLDRSCKHNQLSLICKIYELCESRMARFRKERDAGTYRTNVGYICDLSPNNQWGLWMMALKEVFLPGYVVERTPSLALMLALI